MTTIRKSSNWYFSLKETNLIIEKFEGDLNLASLKNLKSREVEDPLYHKDYPILSDIRTSQPQISLDEIKDYQNFISKLDVVGERQLAILTESPMQVAIASLFKSHFNKNGQEIEIFSTLEAAMHWLNRNNYFEEVKNLLDSKII